MIYISSCYLQYENKTLRLNGSIRSAASRVFIVWYKHGQEPIRLHELSQMFKNIWYSVINSVTQDRWNIFRTDTTRFVLSIQWLWSATLKMFDASDIKRARCVCGVCNSPWSAWTHPYTYTLVRRTRSAC